MIRARPKARARASGGGTSRAVIDRPPAESGGSASAAGRASGGMKKTAPRSRGQIKDRLMSFHPSMDYGRGHHKSARAFPEEGPAFEYTRENRERLDAICARYPADQRKSAILAALYLVQHQQGYITLNGMRQVASAIGCTPADVEDVVSFYTMFYTRPVGRYVLQVCRTLSCALMGAERVTEELSKTLGIAPGRNRSGGRIHAPRGGVPRRVRPRAGHRRERSLARVPQARGRERARGRASREGAGDADRMLLESGKVMANLGTSELQNLELRGFRMPTS